MRSPRLSVEVGGTERYDGDVIRLSYVPG